jgi:exodeoxyribonuclease V alpha subunit
MSLASPAPDALQGAVERVTFHSPDSSFCVLRVQVRGQRELVTVVGSAASITPSELIECIGTWVTDRQYGLQFKTPTLRAVPPRTLEGITDRRSNASLRSLPERQPERQRPQQGV